MGQRIVGTDKGPLGGPFCLYDSVSGWAFGPTFTTLADIYAWLEWLEDVKGIPYADVRGKSQEELATIFNQYVKMKGL